MTTNYLDTFIAIAPDSPTAQGTVPPESANPTVAALQHELLRERPYEFTSDELLFEVHAIRQGLAEDERPAERKRFLAKPQACLRASPLAKRWGWGFHHDAAGRVALVAAGSQEYEELLARGDLTQKAAMRSSRRR